MLALLQAQVIFSASIAKYLTDFLHNITKPIVKNKFGKNGYE
jgi:hypothetical protein